ncbi:MAG: hypothetical protein ACRD32_01780, partial [Nitrososphaerales archaeon]
MYDSDFGNPMVISPALKSIAEFQMKVSKYAYDLANRMPTTEPYQVTSPIRVNNALEPIPSSFEREQFAQY